MFGAVGTGLNGSTGAATMFWSTTLPGTGACAGALCCAGAPGADGWAALELALGFALDGAPGAPEAGSWPLTVNQSERRSSLVRTSEPGTTTVRLAPAISTATARGTSGDWVLTTLTDFSSPTSKACETLAAGTFWVQFLNGETTSPSSLTAGKSPPAV